MGKITNTILALTTLVLSIPAVAQPWYQVEVIIFDYTSPDLDGELWFENPGLPQRLNSIELITAIPDMIEHGLVELNRPLPEIIQAGAGTDNDAENLVAYLKLPAERYRLRDDYRRLELSSAYRPLLHVAWQQPGQDVSEIRYVHLDQLQAGITNPVIPAPEPVTGPEPEVNYSPPDPIIDGLVRVRSTDLLYLDVDFAYFPDNFRQLLELQSFDSAGERRRLVNEAADYVRLTASRRIILNELNFFDHPLFGILVQVSRIETGS